MAMLASMASSLAQDFGIVKITPTKSDADEFNLGSMANAPLDIDNLIGEDVVTQIEDSKYYVVDYNLLGQYWDHFRADNPALYGATIQEPINPHNPFEQFRALLGNKAQFEIVNLLDITAATQDGRLEQDK